MDYDYERYCEILQNLMEVAWIDRDELEIGEDISDIPAIKIIFDGHGDLEEEIDGEYVYTERGNKNMESYAIFIHKDSGTEDFVFPPHELTPWALIHRPKEEVCIYAWFDVEQDSWEFIQLEDRIDEDNTMTAEDVMAILEGLQEKWFNHDEPMWPFPMGERPINS
jgi:hypothetical protein